MNDQADRAEASVAMRDVPSPLAEVRRLLDLQWSEVV
jgi:hypothetical protein